MADSTQPPSRQQIEELSSYTLHLMWMMRQEAVRCFEGIGLRPVKALLLGLIAKGLMTPSVLADMTDMQPSAISIMLTEFEEKGWVRRNIDPQDRRRLHLTLTPAGEELLEEMHTRWQEVAAQRLSSLSSQEIAQLLKIYPRILGTSYFPEPATPTSSAVSALAKDA